MTDTRELVERLRGTSEGAYLTGSNGDVKARHLREAADTIESLQRRIEELEKDAERWRFWREQYKKMILVPSVVLGMDDGDQLDAAIDAARSEGGKPDA